MPSFRIMLHGLDAKDTSSLKSMLGLSSDLLNHEWSIVEQGEAELSIYSFDSEEGQQAWQQHGNGITAVLTNQGNLTESVDIVLKKPLRTSNFSNALNLVADMLGANEVHESQNEPLTDASADTQTNEKHSLLSSLTAGFGSRWFNRKSLPTEGLVAQELPYEESNSDTITKVELLESWLQQLPAEPLHRNLSVHAYLSTLNRKNISATKRLPLIELYFSSIKQQFFKRDADTIKLEQTQSKDAFKAVRIFRGILEQLMFGYKLIIDELSVKANGVNEQSPLLLAINRATEVTGLHILHGYQHYHPLPKGDLGQLHQFYLFLESNGMLHKAVTTKQSVSAPPFFQLYAQILLTGIADPYGLNRFEIIRLFNLMRKFTDKVEISMVNPKHLHLTSDFLLSGHFCLDCAEDKLPSAMSKTAVSIRSSEFSRLVNIQPVLLSLEILFKKLGKSASAATMDLDLQLLKKITPKLNTTYERKYHRLPSVRNRSVHLARGIEAAYAAISGHSEQQVEWAVINQGNEGMMICRPSDGNHLLDIHDLVTIVEKDAPIRLAVVRWLLIDIDDMTQAGIELVTNDPVRPVTVTPHSRAEQYPALIIETSDPHQTLMMLSEKGLFSPKRMLIIAGHGEPYNVTAGHVIDATLDYEQFSYSRKLGS